MEHDIEKLRQAQSVMVYLANGIDPVSCEDATAETLKNDEVISCLKLAADIFGDMAEKSEKNAERHKRKGSFFITEKQRALLTVYPEDKKISEIAKEINRVTKENEARGLSPVCINDWLEAEGYLCRSDLKGRIPTDKGKQLGITYEYQVKDDGEEYYLCSYNRQAQKFIYEHIDDVVNFRNEACFGDDKIGMEDLPPQLSVMEFIQQNHGKCIIMSVGSCDKFSSTGSFIALMLYNGKSKVINKTGISAASARESTIAGILEAATAIRSAADVVILASSNLIPERHGSRKSDRWREIYSVLSEKGCSAKFVVCNGKSSEIREIVKSYI